MRRTIDNCNVKVPAKEKDCLKGISAYAPPMAAKESVSDTYKLDSEQKAALGLADCTAGDEYTLTVNKVNKDGSIDVSIDYEATAEDVEEEEVATVKGKKSKNPAILAALE